ncbi:MAG: TniQ family protein [Verrucomicrobiales bacterium]|jgi:transcriptional regulator with XRE-family HTH domain|nr:TniQ family protein [Verrucomicrobiales bacterium]
MRQISCIRKTASAGSCQLEFTLDIPPRTRLFHLPPYGAGSPQVESLNSWLIRLARAHRISTRILLLQILPERELKITPDRRMRLRTNILANPLRILPWLAKAAHCDNLKLLTLDRWFFAVSRLCLIRKRRAWCPDCLREAPYERLAWTLNLATCCPRHRIRLASQCPRCTRRFPALRLGTCIDRCPYCSCKLTDSSFDPDPPTSWEMHCAEQIGNLLAYTGRTANLNMPNQIANGLTGNLADYSQSEICRLLKINDATLAQLRSRNKTISLELLCRISFLSGVTVSNLLLQSPNRWFFQTPRKTAQWRLATRTRLEDRIEIVRPQLESLIQRGCPSLRAACLALGTSSVTLKRHFPQVANVLLKKSSTRYPACFPKPVSTE